MSAGDVARLVRGAARRSPTSGNRYGRADCPTCHRTDVRLTAAGVVFSHRRRDESGRCPASGESWATVHTGIPAAA